MPLDLADDAWDRVGREIDATGELESVDGVDQADRADLDEVLEALSPPRVLAGQPPHERQVLLDQPLTGFEISAPVVLVEQGARSRGVRCARRGLRTPRSPSRRAGRPRPVLERDSSFRRRPDGDFHHCHLETLSPFAFDYSAWYTTSRLECFIEL